MREFEAIADPAKRRHLRPQCALLKGEHRDLDERQHLARTLCAAT